MSTFQVNVVRIDEVLDHPNADRLSLNRIGGYIAISNKLEDGEHRYRPGQLVVYVPEDAVVPLDVLEQYGYTDENGKGILAGSKGNRVKAVKLRGVVSQGLIFPQMESVGGDELVIDTRSSGRMFAQEGDDVASYFEIVKYEPVIPSTMSGLVFFEPKLTLKFDIENAQKYVDVFEDGEPVIATEKLHGTFTGFTFISGRYAKENGIDVSRIACILSATEWSDSVYAAVFSKGLGAKGLVFAESDELRQKNLYRRMLDELVSNFEFVGAVYSHVKDAGRLTIVGETYGKGVQDLDYGLQQAAFATFGVVGHDGFIETSDMITFCDDHSIPHVPVLYDGPFNIEQLTAIRDGKSIIDGKTVREGIVITPMIEGRDDRIGRRILKMVSPDYLTRKGGTEFQ